MAATQATKEAIWLSSLLKGLGINGPEVDRVPIYTDNQGAMALTRNPEFHAKTKHIDVQWHFV